MGLVSKLFKYFNKQIVNILATIIKLYQFLISPVLHHSCKYYPSCSNYSIGAFKKHGIIKGLILTVKRIVSCNPYSSGGYDPVPDSFILFK